MSDLEKLKVERKQRRRVFTREVNKFYSNIDENKNWTAEEISADFSKIADKADRLFATENQVSELLFSKGEDEMVLNRETDEAETYRDTWIDVVSKKNMLLSKFDSSNDSKDTDKYRNYKQNYKLPKLELKKFNGDIRNWISFWAGFRKVHDNVDLSLEDKFQYLILATEESSPARELVDSFPPSAKNYDMAIDRLKKRFGREELLIELYVRELLNLVLSQATKRADMSLRSLYDKLETQLRSLETLGVTSHKYACMLTPLVESSLPELTLVEWERCRINIESVENKLESVPSKNETVDNRLENLLSFLRKEVEAEERISLAKSVLGAKDTHNVSNVKIKKSLSPVSKIPTASSLVNVKSQNTFNKLCIFCEKQHESENCFKARELSLNEVNNILRSKGCCLICLKRGHLLKHCKSFIKCIICGSRHVPLLCPQRQIKSSEKSEQLAGDGKQNVQVEQNLANTSSPKVLMQTLIVNLKGKKNLKVRALIDTGSQRSYLTKRVAAQLGYLPSRKETLVHALFGGVKSENKSHLCYKVRVWSLNETFGCNFDVLDAEMICQAVPLSAEGPWAHELESKGIRLSDMTEGPIELLIGADVAGKIFTGKKETLSAGLVALETTLGWTIMGKTEDFNDQFNSNNLNLCYSLFCGDDSVSQLWRLDALGIEDPVQEKTKAESALLAKNHFLETTNILPSGRYEVRLPWLTGHPPLPRNFKLAKVRLDRTIQKLLNSSKLDCYREVFDEWLKEGIVEEVTAEEWDVGHYLPHRPVFKEHSTTKVRPVFDASACETNLPALNQCLEKGENLIELIPSILIRFRLGKIGITADIKKAFLQISVHPEDRDVLRFMLIDSKGALRFYRHTRVVFGVSSSPFLLGAVIEDLLQRCEDRIEKGDTSYSKDIIDKLKRSFYVDNCLTSVSDKEELRQFIDQSTAVFREACFELRGWEWSDSSSEEDKFTSILGLKWNRKRDTLVISQNLIDGQDIAEPVHVTRRAVLSIAQKIFDPVGICAPTTLIPKLLVQQTWKAKKGWDDEVEESIKSRFLKWLREVHFLQKVAINRHFSGLFEEGTEAALHVFCDASKLAYGAVVFLRVKVGNMVSISLVEAKARVAPVDSVTIPRLELIAATIGARMGCRILKNIGDIPIFYWSDSSTVLSWIKREEPWGVFVFNRVTQIRNLSRNSSWNHVPGIENPADLLSRGCSPKALLLSKWWEGPLWLRLPPDQWPIKEEFTVNEDEIYEERKKTSSNISLMNKEEEFTSEIFSRYFSKYSMILRHVGWMYRFIFNCTSTKEKRAGDLTHDEIDLAEKLILKMIQQESFNGIKDKKLQRLKPHLDKLGLIRLRTKIWARKDSEEFRAPYILPADHVIVQRLVMEVHKKNGHVVGQGLLNLLRERFWVIKGRRVVRQVVQQCEICRRYASKAFNVEAPPLPEERVRDATVFEVCGTDFAGPFYLNDGSKAWLCLFTCAVYRAVHLDLVSSLSTEAFMLAFRRFIYRRGRPSVMYSDNGTNFVGASNALERIDWNKVAAINDMNKIEWRFNPPTASWWGGFWERLVGLVKNLLKKILAKSSLNKEELYTVFCECEALINARPITYVSDNPEEPIPISPQMFLKETQAMGTPDLDTADANSLNRRLKYLNKLRERLRERFRSEYLGQLNFCNHDVKNTREPVVGEVVLVGSDDKRRLNWPLAKVEEVVPGRDGKIRVLKLKTAEGILVRPLQRVYPLEITPCDDKSSESPDKDNLKMKASTASRRKTESTADLQKKTNDTTLVRELKTRSGRSVVVPVRFKK